MVGRRSRIRELPEQLREAQDGNLFFNGAEWMPLAPGVTEGSGFGPEISFAQDLGVALGEPVGIIKHSVGGTNLAKQWSPDNGKSHYARLLAKVEAARQGRQIEIAGMIWMQGERDSRDAAMSEAYAANLAQLVQTARADFDSPDMPFVAGRVNPSRERYPHVDVVRSAQENCAVPNYSFIDCDDLPKWQDDLHYTTQGIVEMGRVFARAMMDLKKHQP